MKTLTRLLLYAIVPLLTAAAFFAAGVWTVRSCQPPTDTLSVRVDSFIDTVYVETHDTLPILKKEKVLCYVPVSAPAGSPGGSSPAPSSAPSTPAAVPVASPTGSSPDSLPVVQRTYSDDSTYTAYVSGPLYAHWPRLDSITVRQREIVRTFKETVTLTKRHPRLTFGVGAGYGYGFSYRGFEPFVGVTVGYRIYPP